MRTYYTNTISVAYLLFCLFITSSSARSFIRQFTDDFNTTLQQEVGAGPIQNLDLHKVQEISSRDYKVSASNAVKGLRDRRPSSYSLQIDSFNALLRNYIDRYESRPFAVGGYNWKLVVYPNGNYWDSGSGYISLYVAIDNSTPIAPQQEVHTDLRFYIFNKNERKYFTIQDTDVWKFSASKTMWGFPQVLSVDTFKDLRNGYLYDGDHCEFGVDVIIPSLFEKSELLSVTESFPNPRFTWGIQRFSTLLKDSYQSDVFSIGGRSWNLQVYPNGFGSSTGKALTMYLTLNVNQRFRPYEKIFVRTILRVLNQRKLIDYQAQYTDVWKFSASKTMWGFPQVLSVDTFKDLRNGYLYDGDHCEFGVDVIIPSLFEKSELLSVTESFPNPRFTWGIQRFSTLLKDSYQSDVFSIGGRSWNLQVYPNGFGSSTGKALTMYLTLNVNQRFRPYEKIFVRTILRVLNQRKLIDYQAQFGVWYNYPGAMMGSDIISLSDLRDSSKGFIVNDMLKVEVEMVAVSSTKYLPS